MSLNKSTAYPSTPTHHFELLDGLRGVAAIAVVIFHFMELIAPDYKDNFIAHAYLAVDFFFCLSGFVIAYAYDHKLQTIGILSFLKLRLIRLHPLVIIGSVIGLIAFIFDPFSNLHQVYADKIVIMFVASCLMIPYPLVRERYFNLFHLNPPTWSLFWEYVANLLYALVLVKLRPKPLWIVTAIAAMLLIWEARQANYLGVGFGGDTFWGGGIRALYPFLAGMIVYRSQWIIKSRLGFIPVSLLLLLTFFVPFSKSTAWFVDLGIVLIYFPFLIALGAGTRPGAAMAKICRFSGEISYPLYMVHYPFIWLVLSYMEVKKPPIGQLTMITLMGVFLLICFAYVVMRFLDIPIRNYLKRVLTKTA
ncbi:acyltransferase family protein [Spirosoma sp. HMF4905]|uniref:Acyltransferase family protein n=1 Tax=Spirosoma arboris TaxID=2682092 RepID=A0A7K1SK42_9BACT|nr:acyltransferase [Spirosoma arboris]MVM34114.1 acyltransferase family protein [Spirosoma arboris]